MTTHHRIPTDPESTVPNSRLPKTCRTLAVALFCALWIFPVSPTCAADELETTPLSANNSGGASASIARGEKALAVGDYETAFVEYRVALDAPRNETDAESLRQLALDGFTKAGTRLAEQRIAEAQWQDAEDKIRIILQPEYNPGDKTAQKLLKQLEDPEYYNKTITPDFVERVEQVKYLISSADGLADSGRYDEAKKALDSVLELDPYNTAAWQGIERINKAKRRIADMARRAAAPLMPAHTAKTSEWMPMAVLGALMLISFSVVLKGLFGSANASGLQKSETAPSALFPLAWFVLAISLLALIAIATRYEVIFAPDQNGQSVLKVDRWTGAVQWLAD